SAGFTWNEKSYPAGRVIGFEHQARAWGAGAGQDSKSAPLQFFLRMSYHQENPRDRIVLTGNPVVDMTIRPCVAGDPATAAVLVHLAAQSVAAPPGLRLSHELGLLPQGPRYHVSKI